MAKQLTITWQESFEEEGPPLEELQEKRKKKRGIPQSIRHPLLVA